MTLITTTEQLARFCAAQAEAEFVTVDTEFMRERTYYPKLCLVQLGSAAESVMDLRGERSTKHMVACHPSSVSLRGRSRGGRTPF